MTKISKRNKKDNKGQLVIRSSAIREANTSFLFLIVLIIVKRTLILLYFLKLSFTLILIFRSFILIIINALFLLSRRRIETLLRNRRDIIYFYKKEIYKLEKFNVLRDKKIFSLSRSSKILFDDSVILFVSIRILFLLNCNSYE